MTILSTLMQITEQQLTEYKASIEAHRQNIEEIRQRWMHKLESLVENISERPYPVSSSTAYGQTML